MVRALVLFVFGWVQLLCAGSTYIPLHDYERNLTAKQIISFYIQLVN